MNIQRVFNGFTYSKPKKKILFYMFGECVRFPLNSAAEDGCNLFSPLPLPPPFFLLFKQLPFVRFKYSQRRMGGFKICVKGRHLQCGLDAAALRDGFNERREFYKSQWVSLFTLQSLRRATPPLLPLSPATTEYNRYVARIYATPRAPADRPLKKPERR